MIPVRLAELLQQAGLVWDPAPGDVFVLPHRDMDDQRFVLSDMTIEVHQFPTGEVLGFNGTVEWALDSVERHEALWLPREDQLRDHLGEAFVALRRDGAEYVCEVAGPAGTAVAAGRGVDPAEAYAHALLARLLRSVPV